MKEWSDYATKDIIRWFKDNILRISRDKNGDTRSINIFGKLIDFNRYYNIHNVPDLMMSDFRTEEDLQEVLLDYEKKNKKRKNKLPEITYTAIPWYTSIIIFDEWKDVFSVFIGFSIGFVLRSLI